MRRIRLVLASVLAVAALPVAGAQAIPHWSSPEQVVAPPSDPNQRSVGAPEALMAPGGAAYGFSGDGVNPVLLTGSIAGLTARKITTTSSGTARGAAGADGTIAAVWAGSGTGHLAIAPAGGDPGAPVDVPGTGVNAIGAAVAPDGTTTVAWRTHSADGVYQMLVAQVPKGGALSEPQVLDSGKSGIGGVDVAAGGDGSVAAVYTRIASVYRTKASVKPAGASSFEAPQPVSNSAKADLAPNVAFDADGTIVAAWANADAGQVAFRRPGQTAFEAPVSLGTPAYNLELQPTPQGGTALAFATGGDIRAAVQTQGGGFAPVVVGAAPGDVPPQPSIAVDAAGATTVLYADSTDGSVKAVILGGSTTTVGFGKPGTLTPVAVASGPAAQAVALWRDAQNGLSAATFGEDAPAGSGPGTRPGPADTKGPKVRVLSSKRLRVTRKTTALRLSFSCDEPCTIAIAGNLRTTIKGKKRIAPLTGVAPGKATPRAGKRTITVKLGRFALPDLRRALRAKRGAQLFLSITAADTAGNSTRAKATLSLRAKAVKKHR